MRSTMHMMLYVCTMVVGSAIQVPCSMGVIVEQPFGPNGVTYDKEKLDRTLAQEKARYPTAEMYLTIRMCGQEWNCAKP
jgi:hypothetical protein